VPEFIAQNIDEWQDVASASFVPLACQRASSLFTASLEQRQLATDMSIARIQSQGILISRTPRLASQAVSDDIHVSLQVNARGLISQNGRSVRVAPGVVTICETNRPFTLDYFEPEQRHIVVQVSRESLGLSDDIIRSTTGRAVAKGSAAREAFVSYAMTLMRPSGSLPAAQGAQTSQLVTALVSAMIRSESEFADVLPETNESLLVSLQNFIRMNLSSPDLSPDLLAAAHFISRRRLYEIFETVHDSPADAIRRMRVSAAALEIRDPRETRSIAELAFAFGFGDATTFTRSFRRYMGCTPREWRASSNG